MIFVNHRGHKDHKEKLCIKKLLAFPSCPLCPPWFKALTKSLAFLRVFVSPWFKALTKSSAFLHDPYL